MPNSTPINAQHTLDTTGLICPEPIMMLHQIVRSAKSEDIIHMLATDSSTQRDIPKFCTHLQHTLCAATVEQQGSRTIFHYWIQKRSAH